MHNQTQHKVNTDGTCIHIYNAGVEHRPIFSDQKDYETFQGYLEEYLTPPRDKSQIKKSFSVGGKTYHGVPHLPKNYCNQIELVAYSLQPDHFHVMLHVKSSQALQAFMRSLSTRYSIYYNAKYHHRGPVFGGTYKALQLNTISEQLLLTQYLHREGGHTSYPEFLHKRTTAWVKQDGLLSLFEKSQNTAFQGTAGYQRFVETYTLKERETEALERIILERIAVDRETHPVSRPVIQDQPTPSQRPDSVSRSRIPEFIAAVTVFVLLFALGLKNIAVSGNSNNAPPTVLGIQILPTQK